MLNNFVTKPTLITDVGSTKVSVINDFKRLIDNNKILFLPAHPIAGLISANEIGEFTSYFYYELH